MNEDNKRIKKIFKTLRPYVNGKLITIVFERYFDELEKLVLKKCEIAQSGVGYRSHEPGIVGSNPTLATIKNQKQ